MDDKKIIREALKEELLPLFVGLRNELKTLNENTIKLVEKKLLEGGQLIIQNNQDVAVKNFPEIQKVELANEPEVKKVEVVNPNTEIEVKELGKHFFGLGDMFSRMGNKMTEIWVQGLEKATQGIFKVEIMNHREYPTEMSVRVSNPEDLQQKAPAVTNVRIQNTLPSEAVPVRLTTRDGKNFYEAIQALLMGNDVNLKVITDRLEIINTTLENLDITINAGDISIGAVEIKDGDSDTRLDVEDDGGKNAMYVQSNSLSLEATQLLVLSALGDIKGFVDGLEGFTDGIETLLTSIAGYVDGLESLITSTNSKLDSIITNTTGKATEATLSLIKAKTDNIDVALSTRASEATLGLIKVKTDNLDVALSTRATEATLATRASEATLVTIAGYLDTVETKLQSIIDNTDGLEGFTDGIEGLLTSLNGFVDGLEGFTDGLEGLIGTTNTEIGGLTETAPATDTASSGLNGRLQRIAQRITSLIALLPTSIGQKTMAASFPVVIANDQSVVPVSGSAAVGAAPVNPPLSVSGVDATSGFKQHFRLRNVGGLFNLASDISSWFGSTAPTVGQKTSANSIPVVLSSDQSSPSDLQPLLREGIVTYSNELTTSAGGVIASQTIVTPTSGKKLSVKIINISTESTSGVYNLDFSTSVIKVLRFYPNGNGGQLMGWQLHIEGAVNEVLTFSASGAGNTKKFYIQVGYENE